MYVRTPRASVWLDAADNYVDTLPQGFTGSRSSAHRPIAKPFVIEARKAFDGKLGRYIAIKRIPARQGGQDLLLVAVANKSVEERGPWWVRAERALTEREAADWARFGF